MPLCPTQVAVRSNRLGANVNMHPRPIAAGRRVAVRSLYDGDWVRGFSIAEVIVKAGEVWYRIRRHADDVVLPVLFAFQDVMPDRVS